jgi:hypothetical protein
MRWCGSPIEHVPTVSLRWHEMDAVNLDDLTDAFEDASPVMPYFLDRTTGEILLVADALGFIDAERQRLAMKKERARYIPIPPLSTGWREEVMEAYLDRVDDDMLAGQLEAALDLPEPGKAWDKIVGEDARWLAFLRSHIRAHAESWLNEVESNK